MSTSTAVLMKKGKRGAAAYIHADCVGGSPQHLGPLLDVLLNPVKHIDDGETFDWCRWLIAGGRTPDEFAAIVRSYDKHDKCGLVWIPRVVAYRCRTCGISPCMSICRECFHRGDHANHDFNMFLSQAGGACDCGDNSVMKEDGFCSSHGNKGRPTSAPTELMCVAEAMMPRLILRLLQHFREHSLHERANSSTYSLAVQECESYINMLMEFNKMGDLMRKAMIKALINPQMYRNLVEPPFADTPYGHYMVQSKITYERAIESFPAPDIPQEYRSLPALGEKLNHTTLLEEFIFWTFKYEFPQHVVCFLLIMLRDQDYKEHLTRTFVMHYARIPLVLEASLDPDTLSNRVVHMSVQLFSNEALALRCVKQLHLLHVMVVSLRVMMGKIIIPNTLHDPQKNFHTVIDCAQRVMKEHCYWPLVSDLNNVLSHKSVALVFLEDDSLVEMWFELLSMLQGMNVNERETGGHIEYEPSSYYAAFSCELEAAAYPMWSVVAHLNSPEHAPLARRMLSAALAYMHDWLEAIDFTRPVVERSKLMRASFHFPLHRYFAVFLSQAVRFMNVQAKDVLPPPDLLSLVMMHPLRVQSLFYEILSGIWVRNGLQMKGQAMTYIQANFCNFMVDLDIYLLQVCAAHLPKDQFINTCIDMFGVREWLSMEPLSSAQAADQDAMVEGLLVFLAILVSSRTNLGNDELTQSRLEISTLLATGDKTHSQLLELMPERSGNAHTRNFETVLKELSTYRPPPKGAENPEQGLFVPKDEVWERLYDPLQVLQRAVHRRDFQSSMDRFTAYVREKQKSGGASTSSAQPKVAAEGGALWPPLRRARAPPPGAGDPRTLCSSGTLQAALLSVLHRGVHCRARAPDSQDTPAAPHAPPDHVLALAVYLLETAVDLAVEEQGNSAVCVAGGCGGGGGAVRGKPLLASLSAESVCQNVRTVVASVTRTNTEMRSAQPATYHPDSDNEWEPADSEGQLAPPRLAPPVSNALAVPGPMQVAVSEASSMDSSINDAMGQVVRADDAQFLQEDELLDYPLALPGLEEAGLLPVYEDMAVMLPERALEDADMYDDWSVTAREPSPRMVQALPLNVQALPSTSRALTEHTLGGMRESSPTCAADTDAVPVNESILSLLLKLHTQLSGRLDSFSLDEAHYESEVGPERARIGDGPYFIGNLLTKMAALDGRVAIAIGHIRSTLWPNQRERQAEQKARERREKEERSRRAKERQQKMMQDFAQKQKQFMNAMRANEFKEGCGMEWDEKEEVVVEKDYDCVICNTTTPSTPANPIGLVVLLQSTSVLGHRRRAGSEGGRLALSEAELKRLPSQRDTTAAAHHYRLHEEMQQQFDQESWLLSVSVGWEGGVHVQSCGHHLHLHCLHAYLRSLTNPQRPHNLHIERGEFLCPVCRQLANSVLPLSPGSGRPPQRGPPPDIKLLCQDIHTMLSHQQPPPAASKLSEAMGKAMEDMTSTAGAKLKQRLGSSPAAIFTFVASLARTNLECELVQRGGSLVTAPRPPRYKPRKDCIVPLLVVVGAHARVLRGASGALGAADTWSQLCPPPADPASSAAAASSSPHPPPVPAPHAHARCHVPLLLRDPLALLMHFLLLAPDCPATIEMPYFTCMVRVLYKLTYYQVVAQLTASMSAAGRAALTAPDKPGEPQGIRRAARVLLGALAGSELFTEDGPVASAEQTSAADTPDIAHLEQQLQELCLPFLRIASLLRHHLYGEELPDIQTPQQEFVRLVYYLELVTEGMEWSEFSGWRAVWSGATGGGGNARVWAARLGAAAARCQIGVRRLLREQHLVWAQPALLALPRDYIRLFTYYHERNCSQCGAVPKEASVCLLCGALVCLKQACCRQQDVCEAVQHSIECGGGTGIFQVVNTTYIIVIRGRRACLWGALYLDDYDEEDRDLKRGKPLYLSQDRFELLESQWLAHRFDHTKRTWVWHRDSL